MMVADWNFRRLQSELWSFQCNFSEASSLICTQATHFSLTLKWIFLFLIQFVWSFQFSKIDRGFQKFQQASLMMVDSNWNTRLITSLGPLFRTRYFFPTTTNYAQRSLLEIWNRSSKRLYPYGNEAQLEIKSDLNGLLPACYNPQDLNPGQYGLCVCKSTCGVIIYITEYLIIARRQSTAQRLSLSAAPRSPAGTFRIAQEFVWKCALSAAAASKSPAGSFCCPWPSPCSQCRAFSANTLSTPPKQLRSTSKIPQSFTSYLAFGQPEPLFPRRFCVSLQSFSHEPLCRLPGGFQRGFSDTCKRGLLEIPGPLGRKGTYPRHLAAGAFSSVSPESC